ncbi:hypothetical protein [Proteiniphilum sp. UBA5384]|uniref:hypothetical protein n=1 Tax=Proteiniphilum sp. UBA5384 TaxID=1947279 RepID=UPI0025EB227C|nr:hypothetical protein [Proteiniphilum sp. UBA5384]
MKNLFLTLTKAGLKARIGTGSPVFISDRTQHLLWRLQNGNYNVCKPENVVIAIGINNLGGGDTAEGTIAVVDEARTQFPDAHNYFLGAFSGRKGETGGTPCQMR